MNFYKLQMSGEYIILAMFCLSNLILVGCEHNNDSNNVERIESKEKAIHQEIVGLNSSPSNEDKSESSIVLDTKDNRIISNDSSAKREKSNALEKPKNSSVRQIKGVKRYDNFTIYSKTISGDDGHYNGDPMVVFEDKDKKVDTIYLLKNCGLFDIEKTTFTFKEDLLENHFLVDIDDKSAYTNFLDAEGIFNKPNSQPRILLEVSHEYSNQILLVAYTYYSMVEEEVYGVGSEIVAYNSLGTEKGRIVVKGNPILMSYSHIDNLIYVSVGGMLNKVSTYPRRCSVWDLSSGNNIQLSLLNKNNFCSTCWSLKSGLGILLNQKNCNQSFQLLDFYLLDFKNGKIKGLKNEQKCPKGSEVRFFQEYCDCFSKGENTPIRLLYSKDFISMDVTM